MRSRSQYVFKKLVYLIVVVKDIFDIGITYIILSFGYTWSINVYVNIDCMRCLATKKRGHLLQTGGRYVDCALGLMMKLFVLF